LAARFSSGTRVVIFTGVLASTVTVAPSRPWLASAALGELKPGEAFAGELEGAYWYTT
jgi:hypothetical protein